MRSFVGLGSCRGEGLGSIRVIACGVRRPRERHVAAARLTVPVEQGFRRDAENLHVRSRRPVVFLAVGDGCPPAPTALLHYEPGANAPGILTASERALKARLNQGVASIPHIMLVVLDAVFAKELAIFFLERAFAMVFLLGLHVSTEGVELSRAHRKGAVAALPVEGR
jgi:hypothetical protein